MIELQPGSQVRLAAIEPGVQAARVQPMARALTITADRLANHEGLVFERKVRKLMAEASRRAVGDFALTDIVTGYWNRHRQRLDLRELEPCPIFYPLFHDIVISLKRLLLAKEDSHGSSHCSQH